MRYDVIGGPWHGERVSWRLAKALKRTAGYRNPTLAESHAWGWPSVIVWDE